MKKSILMSFAGAVAISGASSFAGYHFGSDNGFDDGFNKAVKKVNQVAKTFKRECINGKIFKVESHPSYKVSKAQSLRRQSTGVIIEAPYYMVDKKENTWISQQTGACYYDTIPAGSSLGGLPKQDKHTLVFDTCEDGTRMRLYSLKRGYSVSEPVIGHESSCGYVGKPRNPKI